MALISELLTQLRLLPFHLDRARFYRNLAQAHDKSVNESLTDFLEAELAISRGKHTQDSSRALAISMMLRRVRTGDELGLARTIGRVMPKGDRLLLIAVDESKDKLGTLRALAQTIDNRGEAWKVIFRSMATPIMLLPGVGALSYVISTKSIPVIAKIAPPEVWTPFNAAVRTVAEGIRDYGLWCLLAIVVGAALYAYALPRWKGPLRMKLEKVNPRISVWLFPVAPWLLPLSIYRDFQAGLLIDGLRVFLESERSLKESVDVLRTESSPWMRAHLRRVLYHLDNNPTEASKAFTKGLLSPALAANLASAIRNADRFEDVLIDVAKEGNQSVLTMVKSSASKINMMLIVMALGTAVFLYTGQMTITWKFRDEMDPIKRTQRAMEKKQGIKVSN